MATSTNSNANNIVVEPLNQRPRAEDVQVADFFPTTKKECREVAARFFFCFTNNGEMKSDQDDDAALRGILFCKKERDAYNQCMLAAIAKQKK
jgi:hypothetical protein